MSNRRVLLFADTNLFIQCRPLKDLPWRALGEFDEIQVVVCRPIQKQIDQLKYRGNDRLAKRARAASAGVIRELVISKGQGIEIRANAPKVLLVLRAELRSTDDFGGRLDLQDVDDQLVAITAEYSHLHPEEDVRVFTHDTGPMGSADAVDVPALAIPDDWLLPPESTDSDKKIAALEAEVSRLKKSEPRFTIACQTQPGDRLELEFVRYCALTAEQIQTVISRLRSELPMANVRRSTTIMDDAVQRALGCVFVPPTADEIIKYESNYTAWLENCEDTLERWHRIANRYTGPAFCFSAENVGTRPAKDALVTIMAQGDFLIMAPPMRKKKNRDADQALPSPPVPPQGERRPPLANALDDLLPQQMFSASRYAAQSLITPPVFTPTPHDPNRFYWKVGHERKPVEQLELECAQWRHGIGPELFRGRFHLRDDQESAAGLLTFSIHAENLSTPASVRLSVRITVKPESAFEHASRAVGALIDATLRNREG